MTHEASTRPLLQRSVAVLALLVAAACAAPHATSAADLTGTTLNIATGSGGVFVLYGAGLADILTRKLHVAASTQATPGSLDNMKLIRDGKADLAFTLADVAFDAVNGQGRFAPPETRVGTKTIAVLYTNFMHVVAKDGAGIITISDLRGKRVSLGAAGSGTEAQGIRVLEAYGLTPADLQVQRLGVQDSADALRDGKLDAFFWSAGLPTGAVADLAGSVKLRFLGQVDGVAKMASKYGPYYFPATIPKGTYGNDSDITVTGVATLLVVRPSFDGAFVKAILQTMFDNQADLVAVHPEAKQLGLATAVRGSPIDFHPAAIEFYKSKGVWQ